MSEKTYRDQIDRYTKDLAALRNQEADATARARKHRSTAAAKRAMIKPSTSDSMRRMYENAAERANKQAEPLEKKAAGLVAKIADRTRKLNTAETNLAREQQSAARRQQQADARRRRTEIAHARKVAQISRPVHRHVYEIHQVPSPQIEELRVLYLTANPLVDDPSTNLRVDAEVARVQRAVRGALHRDYVNVEPRPAATPEDLIDGLNDLSPHVVHFSGHGGGGAVAMDNSDINSPEARHLTFDQLSRAIRTAGSPPTLLVLNACDTVEGLLNYYPQFPSSLQWLRQSSMKRPQPSLRASTPALLQACQ